MSLKDNYYDFVKKYVKKRLGKREVLKQVFNDDELIKIKEIKSFLETIILDNSDEMIKALEKNYKRYIGISIKVNNRLDDESSIFVNHFFDVNDFHYQKDSLYIPKAIYNIGKNKHCEVFFCTSLLRAVPNEFGFVSPERRNKNVVSMSSFFLDLDLPQHLQLLDDESLMNRFENEFKELVRNLAITAVRSGGGLHLYIRTDTMDLTVPAIETTWKRISSNLNLICKAWGSDLRCCGDKVRLLRVPNCVNRKPKYGPNGKEVKLLRYKETIHSTNEIEEVINYILQGGDLSLHQEVLDELTPHEEESNDDLFYSIGEWEDNIFIGITKYTAPKIVIDEYNHLFPELKASPRPETTDDTPSSFEEIEKDTKGEYFTSYKGICIDYNSLPAYEFFQVKDILFFLSNRESSKGIRHSTLFFCGFSWYHFMKIRDIDSFISKCKFLNNFFKPKLSEHELISQAKSNFDYIKRNGGRDKYIRSNTIAAYYKPTEEEMWIANGNYFEEESSSYIEKQRRTHAKRNLEYYHKKRAKEGYVPVDKEQRKKDCYSYLLEHPETTYIEAKRELGISTTLYYELIKMARKSVDYTDEKPDYETCLKEKPNISFKEYHSLCGGSRSTYLRYKKKFNLS